MLCVSLYLIGTQGREEDTGKGRVLGGGLQEVILEKGEMGWGVGWESGGVVCGCQAQALHSAGHCRLGCRFARSARPFPKGGGAGGAGSLQGWPCRSQRGEPRAASGLLRLEASSSGLHRFTPASLSCLK